MKSKKIFKIFTTIAIALVLFMIPCLISANKVTETIRTTKIEVTRQTIDYQSILDEFEDSELKTENSLTTFVGYKSINIDDFRELNLLSETDVVENTELNVKYNFSYDSETNIVTLSAELNDNNQVLIDTITGTAFTNEYNEIDAIMNVDGEYILLSEMQNKDLIECCGWFSGLIKKVVVATVVVVAVSAVVVAVVATAGAGLTACIVAGTVAGVITGGIAGGVISYSEYDKLDWKWIVGGAVVGGALGAVTGWGVGTIMGVSTTQTTQVKGLIDAANKGQLKFSNTVNGYYASGQRAYCNSTTLVKEIMQAKAPIADSQSATGLKWLVEGNLNGTNGVWDLVVDPVTKTIWHFVFRT